MGDFYAARSGTIPPLPWTNFAPPLSLGWSNRFTDRGAQAGEHPYWVRVRQDDGGMAWSSPLYITVAR